MAETIEGHVLCARTDSGSARGFVGQTRCSDVIARGGSGAGKMLVNGLNAHSFS
jgi:hypothetical protein